MIRLITAKRLRELEKSKELLDDTQRKFWELNRICDAWRARYSELQGKYIALKIPPRDIGAEERKRNAERLVADSQAEAARMRQDYATMTMAGVPVEAMRHPGDVFGTPGTLFGDGPADSFAGAGATAAYEARSSDCRASDSNSSSSSDSSSSSSSDCSSSSSTSTD